MSEASSKLQARMALATAPKVVKETSSTGKRATNYQRSGGLRRRAYRSILHTVADLGIATGRIMKTVKETDLIGNAGWRQHQDKVRGAVKRFSRQNPFLIPYPLGVEAERQKAAFISMEGRK